MSVIRAAVLSAAVSLVTGFAAPAMTVADLAHVRGFAAPADFTFGDELAIGRPGRLDRLDAQAARAAAEDYFTYAAVVTLGVLALAGGGLAAFGAGAARRKTVEVVEPAWRASVMRAVQADLAEFTSAFRRAA
jgi:hypothetical protein